MNVSFATVMMQEYTARKTQTQPVLTFKLAQKDGVPIQGELAENCKNADNNIVLTVSAKNGIDVNDILVEPPKLPAVLKQIFEERKCKVIFLNVEPELPYGQFAHVIDVARGMDINVFVLTDGLKKELGYPEK